MGPEFTCQLNAGLAIRIDIPGLWAVPSNWTGGPSHLLPGNRQRTQILAPPAGVEPTTYRLGGGRSIH